MEVWKFHDGYLQQPKGVANDRTGNVFVVGCTSRNLILIQHDGKAYTHLLNLDKDSFPRAEAIEVTLRNIKLFIKNRNTTKKDIENDIQKLSNGVVKEFGEIQVTEHTTNLYIKELKIEQAQIQQNVQPSRNVADINLQSITKVDIKKKVQNLMYITGCSILPYEHLLFVNYYSTKILEYSEEGDHIDSIQVSAYPYDITVLDSDRIQALSHIRR
ncbi:unnamed protein product [Mytilus coruscus]|uniref:Uncharacterized protein n=1 Tax=Mytilus coruscus TaxID=42192 RepID=A0A6J8A6S0_MYTCO|nr:unnamed protein product [Mytilus coruscus]